MPARDFRGPVRRFYQNDHLIVKEHYKFERTNVKHPVGPSEWSW